MWFSFFVAVVLAAILLPPESVRSVQADVLGAMPITAPKVVIISMFAAEAEVWQRRLPESGLGKLGPLHAQIPGLSMHFQDLLCLDDGTVCQVTTGYGEINAAATITALTLSDVLDLTNTYFVVSGIAGVNPRHGTLGSVAIAKYAVQVALQYELDSSETPDDWESGYVGYGSSAPFQCPTIIYGTEVFQLNEKLRDHAFELANNATLDDSDDAAKYRHRYDRLASRGFGAASKPPSIIKCDIATSDVYYSGNVLSSAFEKTVSVWTNGAAQYCMTASEDNATLEALVRAAMVARVDFSRVIVMRSGSNFDRPPEGVTAHDHLLVLDQNGFGIAIENLFNAGIHVVRDIIDQWECRFEQGLPPQNYVGDVFGSLGGQPNFCLNNMTNLTNDNNTSEKNGGRPRRRSQANSYISSG